MHFVSFFSHLYQMLNKCCHRWHSPSAFSFLCYTYPKPTLRNVATQISGPRLLRDPDLCAWSGFGLLWRLPINTTESRGNALHFAGEWLWKKKTLIQQILEASFLKFKEETETYNSVSIILTTFIIIISYKSVR